VLGLRAVPRTPNPPVSVALHRTTTWTAALAAATVIALPTASGARTDTRTHRFAPATDVTVSFVLARHRGSGAIVRFTSNRVSLIRTRSGRLSLRIRGRHTRRIPARRHRVVLTLSSSSHSATLKIRRRSAHLPGTFVLERAVAVRRRAVRGFRIATRGYRAPAPVTPPATQAAAEPRLFAADSVWNAPLPGNAPLDPANATLVNTFRATVAQNMAASWGPWISATDTTSLYTVPSDQPTVRVAFDPGSWKAGLQQAFQAVPIPANAKPAAGPDAHMTIWQPSTDRLWEMWHARKAANGWHASFGGAMTNVSTSPGYFDTNSWPGLSQPWWGATATSLPAIAGAMMIDELQAGVIPHALAIAIPTARAKTYSLPAQRTDGKSTDPRSIPEGARFRLDPNLDLSKLNLPPVTRAIAVAAQSYGMIVRDVTNHAISFYAENPGPSGTNPYPALYGSRYPLAIMKAFPWDRLQLVKMDLRTMK
jgi:hypothetical protein